MFENLTDRLGQSLKGLAGQGQLTEDNIRDTLREVRKALLEADVALPVVKEFVEQVKEKALGQEVLKSLNPGQAFVKIVNDELVHTMGDANDALNLASKPPVVIMMAGLQGAGKTTSVAKLARFLQEREKKKVMVVSADVYRPAAIDQLQTLAGEVKAEFFPSTGDQDPVDIANNALAAARSKYMDVLIVDTAGRLHVDEQMMGEISRLHGAISPAETLFVVDAMTGQDAANTAQAFNEALPLTGVILTKADGDSRGGAALSVRHLTGKPIKFIGMGEKTDALEPFHPDRIASRILGMGDVLSLVEQAERTLDKKKADKIAKKFKKGRAMDFEDLKDQFQQMRNMGGMASLLDKLPGMGGMMEEWHQKLHNNTSPDDVPICEALLKFIAADCDISVYWDHLHANGITKERMASYDRKICGEPSFKPDQYEGLTRDLKEYLRTLKAVHSGADLDSAAENVMGYHQDACKGKEINMPPVTEVATDRMRTLLHSARGFRDLGEPLHSMEAMLEARRELWNWTRPGGADNSRLKDVIYLDLALESAVRQVVEANLSSMATRAPVDVLKMTGLALENLALSSGGNDELVICLQQWQGVVGSAMNGGNDWALQAKSVVDRVNNALGEVSQRYINALQPTAHAMGGRLGVDGHVLDMAWGRAPDFFFRIVTVDLGQFVRRVGLRLLRL